MIRKMPDPVSAIEACLECLVLSYRYDLTSKTVTLVVCDYPDKLPASDLAFLRITFTGVLDFNRIPGLYAELQRFIHEYALRDTRATSVIQNIKMSTDAGVNRVLLDLGCSFGQISITYDAFVAESRNTRAIKRDETVWEYYDFDDDSPLDFYHPFG